MKLDVKVKGAVITAIGRSLVQRHYVWKRHPPKVVELHEDSLQHIRKIVQLFAGQVCYRRVRLLRRDKYLVCVARKIRDKRDRRIVLRDDPSSVFNLRRDHILKENASVLS